MKLVLSAIIGSSIIGLTFLISSITTIPFLREIGIATGLAAIVLPYAMKDLKTHKRKSSIDANIPHFLLEVTSSVNSGMNLLRAIENAADRNLGSLTNELRILRAKIHWGVGIDESFESIVKSMGTLLSRRIFMLLLFALRSGGSAQNLLEMVQVHVTELQNLEKERKTSMRPYILTIYISFMVFLATTTILVNSFFTEISSLQSELKSRAEEMDINLGQFSMILGMDISNITTMLFHMSIVEALFAGLVAGKIGEGSVSAGIKHVAILLTITIIVFVGFMNN